ECIGDGPIELFHRLREGQPMQVAHARMGPLRAKLAQLGADLLPRVPPSEPDIVIVESGSLDRIPPRPEEAAPRGEKTQRHLALRQGLPAPVQRADLRYHALV